MNACLQLASGKPPTRTKLPQRATSALQTIICSGSQTFITRRSILGLEAAKHIRRVSAYIPESEPTGVPVIRICAMRDVVGRVRRCVHVLGAARSFSIYTTNACTTTIPSLARTMLRSSSIRRSMVLSLATFTMYDKAVAHASGGEQQAVTFVKSLLLCYMPALDALLPT